LASELQAFLTDRLAHADNVAAVLNESLESLVVQGHPLMEWDCNGAGDEKGGVHGSQYCYAPVASGAPPRRVGLLIETWTQFGRGRPSEAGLKVDVAATSFQPPGFRAG